MTGISAIAKAASAQGNPTSYMGGTFGGSTTPVTASGDGDPAVVGVILNLALWLGLHVLFAEVGTLGIGPLPAWCTSTTQWSRAARRAREAIRQDSLELA